MLRVRGETGGFEFAQAAVVGVGFHGVASGVGHVGAGTTGGRECFEVGYVEKVAHFLIVGVCDDGGDCGVSGSAGGDGDGSGFLLVGHVESFLCFDG